MSVFVLFVGIFSGFFSGLLGLGGGLILFSAVGGIAGKLTTAQVPLELALIIVAGSVPSAQAGTIVSHRMQPRLLRYALALAVGGAAVRIWFDVLS